MATTYLDLCNQVLRRLNEVEIISADFSSATGVQALVKDVVKASLAKVNQREFEWPFNAAEETDTLVVGQEEYTWPTSFKVADYNSFQLQKDATLGINHKTLKYIERDEWYDKYRDDDDNAGSAGIGCPKFVFPSHGNGYGVSPSPDKAYSIKFRYFLNFSDLTDAGDVSRIPESHDAILVDGALYRMYLFKDNVESAQMALMAFEEGLKDLQTLYVNNYEYIRDRRVRY